LQIIKPRPLRPLNFANNGNKNMEFVINFNTLNYTGLEGGVRYR